MKIVVTMLVMIFASAVLLGANSEVTLTYHDRVAPGQLLDVRDLNGSITIATGARLTIHVVKTAGRGNPDDVRVTTNATPAGLIVCVRYARDGGDCASASSGGTNGNDTRVDLTIAVPAGVNVAAQTANGSIDIRSDAKATASTVNGSVSVDAADVDRVTNVNGSITVRVRGSGSHSPLHVETVNGSLTCTLAAGGGATVRARSLNGQITGAGLTIRQSDPGSGASADGVFGDGSHRVDLRTLNGSIRVDRA